MSKFVSSISELQGKKVRFFVGGGEKGYVQGPVERVDGNMIYILKEGEIRGTMHAITVNADEVRYFEQDILLQPGQ
ncbi:MAG: hypothetical protein O7E54_07670 [Planctomycetota bacterium]|nr:hypothetical protein [Planctomycetota bacterium]